MVANHSGTGTGYGVFTDSYRTGKFSAINDFSTIRKTKNSLDFCAALTKINIGFLKAIAIPSQCFFTNSNVTGLSYIRRRNCTLTDGYIFVIRCRISSHRRSHACTGHHTCCNQHCQQLFGRAAFTAMIFRNFGDNNVSIACFTPNYLKYFVHQ